MGRLATRVGCHQVEDRRIRLINLAPPAPKQAAPCLTGSNPYTGVWNNIGCERPRCLGNCCSNGCDRVLCHEYVLLRRYNTRLGHSVVSTFVCGVGSHLSSGGVSRVALAAFQWVPSLVSMATTAAHVALRGHNYMWACPSALCSASPALGPPCM